MGFNSINLVLKHSKAKGSDRLVLLILAHHANDETGECFPSRQLISEESGIKERSLIYRLKALEALGEISISRGNGSGHLTKYKLNPAGERVQPVAPFQEEKGCNIVSERVQYRVQKGATGCIAYKEELKGTEKEQDRPFDNPGIGDALEEVFPGYSTDFRKMQELYLLCSKLQATAQDVFNFPGWLKKTYPMKSISIWAFKDLLAESLQARPQIKKPDPYFCPTCRGKKVILKLGMEKFRNGTPTMPCPDCAITSSNSTENSNVISTNRFAIA